MTNLITRTYNKEKVFKLKPALIGVVHGIRFYEHPLHGDHYPLIAVKGDQCGLTDYWDMPTVEELIDHSVI